MINLIHHITRTTFNDKNPFGLREPFGVASTNIDLVREQIAVQAAEYLKNGLGEGFKTRDGEILQHDQEGSLKVTKTNTGIGCEFTGNEITFWLAEEDETNFDQGVKFEIFSHILPDAGYIYPSVPNLDSLKDIAIINFSYCLENGALSVFYHQVADEETLKHSLHPLHHLNIFKQENGRTFSGHTDMNGDFNWDNQSNNGLEECIPEGWQRDLLASVRKEFEAYGLPFNIKKYTIGQTYPETN